MAFKPFKQIRIDESSAVSPKAFNDAQNNIAIALAQILGKDQLDSAMIKNVSLLPGLNKISHTLNRNIQGWHAIRPREGYAILWEDVVANKSPNLLVYIHSAAACVVDLLVF